MSRQVRGGGRAEVARGAGYAAFLGAVLIGVAVIIGIVLLQIGDRDNGPNAGASTPKSTTTTTKPPTSSTTPDTSGTTSAARPPSQINLIVLNGGAPSGQAAHVSSKLRLDGYTNQDTANTWTGHHQSGDSVYCRVGFDREGPALATRVADPGEKSATFSMPYPSPAPPFTEGTDCVVIVGS